MPGGRYYHALFYNASAGVFYVHGGMNSNLHVILSYRSNKRPLGYGYVSSATTTSYGDLSDIFRYNMTSQMWTWVGGQTNINLYGSIGTLGLASTNNKLISVQGHVFFAGENPLRLYTWGGDGCASSVPSNNTCKLQRCNNSRNLRSWQLGSCTILSTDVHGQLVSQYIPL